MKNILAAILVLSIISFTIVIGTRLPVGAITVIVGVGCGVLASIPTSLLIVAVTSRRGNSNGQAQVQQQTYPPVVVVNAPPSNLPGMPGWPAHNPSWGQPAAPIPRQFHVIGQENELSDGGHHSSF